jgi:predicted ribosomally synthesized peptide with SipW-like signal peptide
MRTRKWAAAVAVSALALGLIGAGVAATFTDSATATHRIDVGVLDVTLASDTPGAQVSADGQTLTCPSILVSDSEAGWDFVGCHIQIVSAGTIQPDRVDLSASVWTNGADLSKFALQLNEGAGGWTPPLFGDTPMLSTIDGSVISSAMSLPADVYAFLGWPVELGNSEMGKSIVVTYAIEAVA